MEVLAAMGFFIFLLLLAYARDKWIARHKRGGDVTETVREWKLSSSADPEWQAYHDQGLPWTGEFEDAVNRGEVDVS